MIFKKFSLCRANYLVRLRSCWFRQCWPTDLQTLGIYSENIAYGIELRDFIRISSIRFFCHRMKVLVSLPIFSKFLPLRWSDFEDDKISSEVFGFWEKCLEILTSSDRRLFRLPLCLAIRIDVRENFVGSIICRHGNCATSLNFGYSVESFW